MSAHPVCCSAPPPIYQSQIQEAFGIQVARLCYVRVELQMFDVTPTKKHYDSQHSHEKVRNKTRLSVWDAVEKWRWLKEGNNLKTDTWVANFVPGQIGCSYAWLMYYYILEWGTFQIMLCMFVYATVALVRHWSGYAWEIKMATCHCFIISSAFLWHKSEKLFQVPALAQPLWQYEM